MKSHLLSADHTLKVINTLQRSDYNYEFDQDKHRIQIGMEGETFISYLRLPINFQFESKIFSPSPTKFIMLLIQSGSCAIGYFEDDRVIDHKVIKSYMVRKKQGKSQLKYLNKKGKSRAGSRVRLANTLDFFNNINERLQTYSDSGSIDRIAISCSKSLIPYLYNARIDCPFDKKDDRLYKIPKHINIPNYEVLLATHKFLLRGELIYDDKYKTMVDDFLVSC